MIITHPDKESKEMVIHMNSLFFQNRKKIISLLDFELELTTSNKEPEDNIQQIKQERIEQGANQ